MDQRHGIVLKKHFSKKRTIAVLDSKLGRVDYIPDTENICTGALVSYWVVQRKGISFIYGIENINIPLLLGRHDILFFHHVLEVCYYFVPIGSGSLDVYALVSDLYTTDYSQMSSSRKKLFLVKLFTILGIYPLDQRIQKSTFFYRVAGSIDITLDQDLDLSSQKELDDWLRSCLSHHPALAKFKTMDFLDESRVYEKA